MVVDNIARDEILDYEKRGDCYTWCFPINFGEFNVAEIWNQKRMIQNSTEEMTLYIHIPYCKFICSMCPFTHEIVKQEELNQYVECLIKEIEMYGKHEFSKKCNVSTIYFGGGTASMLSSEQVKSILSTLRAEFHLTENCEISLECHPNTVTEDYLKQIRTAGVTRVSFGIQSFQQKNLSSLNLWQNATRNREVIQTAMKIGFNTVAIDLMYNFPDESMEDLLSDISYAYEIGVQGLSFYALDPEVRKLSSVKEQQMKMQLEKDMFYKIRETLLSYGYVQVAQPDYALPGHENRQIMDLWGAPQKQNLGFGAGAFSESFNLCSWANIHDPQKYIECIEQNKIPILMGRVWSEDDQIARYMALGVRMLNVPLLPFQKQFGLRVEEIYKYEIEKLMNLGYVEIIEDKLCITKEGSFYIDNISKTFFNLSNRGRAQYWGCKLREYAPKHLYAWDEVI